MNCTEWHQLFFLKDIDAETVQFLEQHFVHNQNQTAPDIKDFPIPVEQHFTLNTEMSAASACRLSANISWDSSLFRVTVCLVFYNVLVFIPLPNVLQKVPASRCRSTAVVMSPHQQRSGIKRLGEKEPDEVSSTAARWTPQTGGESQRRLKYHESACNWTPDFCFIVQGKL